MNEYLNISKYIYIYIYISTVSLGSVLSHRQRCMRSYPFFFNLVYRNYSGSSVAAAQNISSSFFLLQGPGAPYLPQRWTRCGGARAIPRLHNWGLLRERHPYLPFPRADPRHQQIQKSLRALMASQRAIKTTTCRRQQKVL